MADALGLPQVLGRTRRGNLALFLTLARVAHPGSRLSALRWAPQQAVREVLGRSACDEDALSATLDALAQRQARLAQQLYRRYVERRGSQPVLFLYDGTSSYLEGAQKALGASGSHRAGKRGKPPLVLGLLTDEAGEPLAVRGFAGKTAAPPTVPTQSGSLKPRFAVEEGVFVGAGGRGNAQGKAALTAERIRYRTAWSTPQGRRRLKRTVLPLELFDERVGEVQAEGTRYLLRKNAAEARKARHRLAEKLAMLRTVVAARTAKVAAAPRCQPEAGWRGRQAWGQRHQRHTVVALALEERQLTLPLDAAAHAQLLQLAGCDVLETDVPAEIRDPPTAHERYKALAQGAQDRRMLKPGGLEVRPIFGRKDLRTRRHVFVCLLALKLSREVQRRLAAPGGTTKDEPHGVTLQAALDGRHRLCVLTYPLESTRSLPRRPRPDDQPTRILQAWQVALPRQGACRQEQRPLGITPSA